MRLCIIAALAATLLNGPLHADDAQSFVADWLDRCYAAADAEYADIPLPRDRNFEDARLKANFVEFGCGIGPNTICRHSDDPSGCLTIARLWMERERDRIIAQLPRELAEGQSNTRRRTISRYYDFIATGGQAGVPGLGVEGCIGTGAQLPELGFTRAECEVRQVSIQLSQARSYDRRIVAGILK